jgi:hypothetical protein
MRNWISSLALTLGIGAFLLAPDIAFAELRPPDGPNRSVIQWAQADDFDCEDFETQEEAQAVLDDDPADPNNLDPNRDGIACALLPTADDQETDPGDDAAVAQDADAGNETQEERGAARRAARQQGEEGTPSGEESAAVTCADFETQEEAQAAFDADPEGLGDLDADDNGIACEELLESGSDENTQARDDRQRNRRNQEEEPAPTEVVVDEPRTVRIREDFDCVDFEFQEEAQEVYDEDRSDPFNLDPSGDGIACSSLPSSDPRVLQVPRTGIGNTTDFPSGLLAAASLLTGLASAGASWRRSTR